MNPKEFEAIIKKPPNNRYEYFVKKVADFEEVWGLYHDGWASADDGQGNMLIPFFPREEFAQYVAVKEWLHYKPKRIDLYEFMNEWCEGMKKDGVKPSIFPTDENTAVVAIDVLCRDLQMELEKY